ncbi:hypothetical protein B0H13DRAFT_2402490 [Mycena leptocephala]|nr:hypothetical protein B0H13DRAFT_2402490 [Mycena leptocephala]
MKTNTDKVSLRVSPLRSSTISNTPPRLTHPRHASSLTLDHNKKLFASELVKGEGILSSQVTDTQFLMVGVDVSAIVSSSPSAPVPSDTIVSSPNSETPGSPELPDTGLSQPVDENSDWSTENSWNYEAMIGLASPSPARTSTPSPQSKSNPESMTVKAEPAGDHVIDTTFTSLTSFEKWVITRIRESNGDGISFSAWLKGLKERCEFWRAVTFTISEFLRRSTFTAKI